MRQSIPFISALFVLILMACQSNKGNKAGTGDSDSLKKERLADSIKSELNVTRDTAKDRHIHSSSASKSDKPMGAWALLSTDNVTFTITKNSFIYPESNEIFAYTLMDDTIMIDYKARIDTFKIKFKGVDTLSITNRLYGDYVYYRFKN